MQPGFLVKCTPMGSYVVHSKAAACTWQQQQALISAVGQETHVGSAPPEPATEQQQMSGSSCL